MITMTLPDFVSQCGSQYAAAIRLNCTAGNISKHMKPADDKQVLVSIKGEQIEAVIVRAFNGSRLSMNYRPVPILGTVADLKHAC